MINTLIKRTLPFIILIGTILVAFGISQIDDMTVISQNSVNYGSYTWNYYKFDLYQYIKNLENSLQVNNLVLILPKTPELASMPEAWDIIGILKFIVNSYFIYLANWVIYAFNWILLAPLKIILYPINILFTILGINTSNQSYVNTIRILYQWQLPYIPNI